MKAHCVVAATDHGNFSDGMLFANLDSASVLFFVFRGGGGGGGREEGGGGEQRTGYSEVYLCYCLLVSGGREGGRRGRGWGVQVTGNSEVYLCVCLFVSVYFSNYQTIRQQQVGGNII